MLAVVHPDVKFRNVSAGEVPASTRGGAEPQRLAQDSLAPFTERRQAIDSFAAMGATAIATIAFHAVVACDLPNGLTRGQVLKLTGRTEFALREGPISAIVDVS